MRTADAYLFLKGAQLPQGVLVVGLHVFHGTLVARAVLVGARSQDGCECARSATGTAVILRRSAAVLSCRCRH